jgi:hypothetical protein
MIMMLSSYNITHLRQSYSPLQFHSECDPVALSVRYQRTGPQSVWGLRVSKMVMSRSTPEQTLLRTILLRYASL